jgi:hypothetical protein
MSFHPEILSAAQRGVLLQLGLIMTQQQFYQVGRTALAIHLGHRYSDDLDWFTGECLADPIRLAQDLRDAGVPFITAQIERGTLHGSVGDVACMNRRKKLVQLQCPIMLRCY